jgi:hypothetical protein
MSRAVSSGGGQRHDLLSQLSGEEEHLTTGWWRGVVQVFESEVSR